MSDYLGDRRKALEEGFFAQQERKLLDEIREQKQTDEGIQALAGACGVRDEAVLAALLHGGIEVETLPALTLIPLVVVAWASGKVEETERKAVLEAAAAAGISRSEPPYALLEAWLSVRPPEKLFDAWLAYASELREILDADERATLRDDLVDRATAVADAAGGVLGIGPRISAAEKRVLQQIKDAL